MLQIEHRIDSVYLCQYYLKDHITANTPPYILLRTTKMPKMDTLYSIFIFPPIYFYFMHMSYLPACLSVQHVHANIPEDQKRVSFPRNRFDLPYSC